MCAPAAAAPSFHIPFSYIRCKMEGTYIYICVRVCVVDGRREGKDKEPQRDRLSVTVLLKHGRIRPPFQPTERIYIEAKKKKKNSKNTIRN